MTTAASRRRKKSSGVELPAQQQALLERLQQDFPDVLRRLDDGAWQYDLTFGVQRENALQVFTKLRDDERYAFNFLMDITAVDWLDSRELRFEVVYIFLSLTYNSRLRVKISVDEDDAEVDSVRSLWPAANFLEREVWDMFGIRFKGHGDLRRILLYDEFEGHPLRKDYPILRKHPRIPLRLPELHNTSADMHREQLVSLPTRQRPAN